MPQSESQRYTVKLESTPNLHIHTSAIYINTISDMRFRIEMMTRFELAD